MMNQDNTNDTPKKKKIHNRNIIYANEQKVILDKVLKIIGVNENCKMFFTYYITDDMKKKLDELVDDIKLYYKTSNWAVFRSTITPDKYHIALIRSILKDNNINYICSTCKIKNNNNVINTSLYKLDF